MVASADTANLRRIVAADSALTTQASGRHWPATMAGCHSRRPATRPAGPGGLPHSKGRQRRSAEPRCRRSEPASPPSAAAAIPARCRPGIRPVEDQAGDAGVPCSVMPLDDDADHTGGRGDRWACSHSRSATGPILMSSTTAFPRFVGPPCLVATIGPVSLRGPWPRNHSCERNASSPCAPRQPPSQPRIHESGAGSERPQLSLSGPA